jgi:hypothetical protein
MREPNAEGAEVSQKSQKKTLKNFLLNFFCDFCAAFATSAFGCPLSEARLLL